MSATLYAIGSWALTFCTSFDTLAEAETDAEMEEALRNMGTKVEKLYFPGATFTAIAVALMALTPESVFNAPRVAKEALAASALLSLVGVLGSGFLGHLMGCMGVSQLRRIVFASRRRSRNLSMLSANLVVAHYSGQLLCAVALIVIVASSAPIGSAIVFAFLIVAVVFICWSHLFYK